MMCFCFAGPFGIFERDGDSWFDDDILWRYVEIVADCSEGKAWIEDILISNKEWQPAKDTVTVRLEI